MREPPEFFLLSGGNDGVGKDGSGAVRRGTYDNVHVYFRRNGVDLSPSLTRFHPEIREPADRLPTEQSCTELVRLSIGSLRHQIGILQGFWS